MLLRLESVEQRVCRWRRLEGGTWAERTQRLATRKGLKLFRFYPKGIRDSFKVFFKDPGWVETVT